MDKKVTVSDNKGTKKASKKAKVKTYGADSNLKNTTSSVNEAAGVLDYKINALHFLPTLNENRASYQYQEVNPLLTFLGYNQGESSELLETNASTISRWKNSKIPVDIGKLRSKVLIDLDEIISKGVRIFGDELLFQEWLNTSNHALGDVKPIELLKDVYAIEHVDEALDALSWGTYL